MTKPIKTKFNEQEIQNQSFDTDFGVSVVELLAYDSVGNVLKRVTSDSLNYYSTQDVDKVSTSLIYEGLMDSNGSWQIVQTTTSGTVTSIRFATQLNNPSYTDYPTAWTNRATLVYDYYNIAF